MRKDSSECSFVTIPEYLSEKRNPQGVLGPGAVEEHQADLALRFTKGATFARSGG